MKNFNEIKRLNLIRLMTDHKVQRKELAEMLGGGKKLSQITQLLKPTGHKHGRNIGPKILKELCAYFQVDESEFLRSDALEPQKPATQWCFTEKAILKNPLLKHLVLAANDDNRELFSNIVKKLCDCD